MREGASSDGTSEVRPLFVLDGDDDDDDEREQVAQSQRYSLVRVRSRQTLVPSSEVIAIPRIEIIDGQRTWRSGSSDGEAGYSMTEP
jgi:hypothetical protein